jgi:ribosomal protein S27E
MMGPRITDYDAWRYCETCANITVMEDWDTDARMCKACAIVMDETQGGEDGADS